MTKIFIQTTIFEKKWAELGLSDDELSKLEEEIMRNPEVGSVIPGTGRVRKMRFALQDRGKRGGVRVCYVDFVVLDTIYLITAYSKKEKDNLTPRECAKLKALVEELERSLM